MSVTVWCCKAPSAVRSVSEPPPGCKLFSDEQLDPEMSINGAHILSLATALFKAVSNTKGRILNSGSIYAPSTRG